MKKKICSYAVSKSKLEPTKEQFIIDLQKKSNDIIEEYRKYSKVDSREKCGFLRIEDGSPCQNKAKRMPNGKMEYCHRHRGLNIQEQKDKYEKERKKKEENKKIRYKKNNQCNHEINGVRCRQYSLNGRKTCYYHTKTNENKFKARKKELDEYDKKYNGHIVIKR